MLSVRTCDQMKGFIYILENPSFPYVKVGMTKSDPNGRARELSDTSSLPFPFELAWYALVEEYKNAERIVHEHLANVRVNPRREFFEIAVSEVIRVIKAELEIVILYEEQVVAVSEMNFDAALSYDESERWKRFVAPPKYPFRVCPDCKQRSLGVLGADDEPETDGDEEVIQWANVVGSIVSSYPEIRWSPGEPHITHAPRRGPYFCWNCYDDKDYPSR